MGEDMEGSFDSLLDSMDPQQEEDDGDEDSFWFALKIVLIVYNDCCKQKVFKKIAIQLLYEQPHSKLVV